MSCIQTYIERTRAPGRPSLVDPSTPAQPCRPSSVTSAAGGVGVLVRLHPLNTEPERVEILALCSRVAVHARRMVELFVVATVFGLKADVEAHLRHPIPCRQSAAHGDTRQSEQARHLGNARGLHRALLSHDAAPVSRPKLLEWQCRDHLLPRAHTPPGHPTVSRLVCMMHDGS